MPRTLDASRPRSLAAAADVLRRGGVVAFPTETVYGLGARWDDPAALRRLAALKRRPRGKPFQLLASSCAVAERLVGRMPPQARRLAAAFWPGPLTIVMADGRGRRLGIRVPSHPVARSLARRLGGVIAATSANLSGRPPALTADEVASALGDAVALILDGGRAPGGTASTVVQVGRRGVVVLREGAITAEKMERVLHGGER